MSVETVRSFWVMDPNGSVVQMPEPEVVAYYQSGYARECMLVGDDTWRQPGDYQLALAPPPPPPPPAAQPAAPMPPMSADPEVPLETGFLVLDTESGGLDPRIHPLLSVAVVVANKEVTEVDGFALRVAPPRGTVIEIPVPEHVGADRRQRRQILDYVDIYTQRSVPREAVVDLPIITSVAAEVNGFVEVVDTPTGKAWNMDPAHQWLANSVSLEEAESIYLRFISRFFAAKPVPVAHNAAHDQKFIHGHLRQLSANIMDDWVCTYRLLERLLGQVLPRVGAPTKRGTWDGGTAALVRGNVERQAAELGEGLTRMLRRLCDQSGSRSGLCTLDALAEYCGFVNPNPHEALADSRTCLAGLRWLRQEYRRLNI